MITQEKEIANLFWHGELSALEIACIKSFVNNGFHTKLWSYNNLSVEGAESCDARLVLPEEDLQKYKQIFQNDTNSTRTFHASMAAFSDAFRLMVVDKFGGWWFDCDCYCLKSELEFKQLRKDKLFVAGVQDYNEPSVNASLFWSSTSVTKHLIDRLNELCNFYNYNFPEWGIIGPNLFTDVVQKYELFDDILPIQSVYSIHAKDVDYYFEPSHKQYAKDLIKDSYVTHIWSSCLNRNKYQINNPPVESLLHEFYTNTYVKSSNEVVPNVSNDYNKSLEMYKNISIAYKKVFNVPANYKSLLFYAARVFNSETIEETMKHYLNRQKIISELYKNILNREPDEYGLIHYTYSNLSIDNIKIILENSEEYNSKKISIAFTGENRIQLINFAIEKTCAKNYLEIGCDNNLIFNNISVENKIGVDPVRGGTLRMTSDEFFKNNTKKFDVIFIDGLHEYHQVSRDFENSLKCLNDGGIIILHDMLPKTSYEALMPIPDVLPVPWLGDVWKLSFDLMAREDITFNIVLIDFGCGIVHKNPQVSKKINGEYTWNFYEKNWNELPLVSYQNYLNQHMYKNNI
jgi:hypothetical protein